MEAKTVESVVNRLKQRGAANPETGCIEWTGTLHRDGYGKMTVRIAGRDATINAHRLSYMVNVGEIPDGLMVCHTCDNRKCINPEHLFCGTAKDNAQDMIAKDRHWKGQRIAPKGEASPRSKLTAEAVNEIRDFPRCRGMLEHLAKKFGVTPTAIRHVLIGRTWNHI